MSQALRVVIHNYPSVAFACWEQISTLLPKVLRVAAPEVPARAWKGHMGENIGFTEEKVITAAIKVTYGLHFPTSNLFCTLRIRINIFRNWWWLMHEWS